MVDKTNAPQSDPLVEKLKARLQQLVDTRDNLIGQINQVLGRIAEVEELLKGLETPNEPPADLPEKSA